MKKRFITVILAFLLLSVYIGYRAYYHAPETNRSEMLSVVCTTSIIADMAKRIAGDRAHVAGLMGPGIDPHIYQARPRDIEQLLKADLVFSNGLHLEGKMGSILLSLDQAGGKSSYAVTDGIDRSLLLSAQEFEDVYDPHVWFSVPLWKNCVVFMKDCFIKKDPDHAAAYQQNANRLLRDLDDLNDYIRSRVDELPSERRILLTAHDAFSYFGREYGFSVNSLQGISTDSEISVQDIVKMVDYIILHRVPAVFIENLLSRRSIESVKQAVAAQGKSVEIGPSLYTDALGPADSPAGTYTGMVKEVVDHIVDTLKKRD